MNTNMNIIPQIFVFDNVAVELLCWGHCSPLLHDFSWHNAFRLWIWWCDLCLRGRWKQLLLRSVWPSVSHWPAQTTSYCSSSLWARMTSTLITQRCLKVPVLMFIGSLQVNWGERKAMRKKHNLENSKNIYVKETVDINSSNDTKVSEVIE